MNARDDIERPSRAEIETLCLLYAISAGPCTVVELAVRLGFGESVAGVIREALESQGAAGTIEFSGNIVRISNAGAESLRRRLVELDVA